MATDEMTVLAALREEIERLDPRALVEVSGPAGNEQLHLRHDRGTQNTASLHNLRNQLRDMSVEAAAGTIERFARICVAGLFSGAVEETETIMPVVRDRAYVDSLRDQTPDPACRELSTCGTLFVCLALDNPEYMRYLERSDLEGLGFAGFEEAEERAVANLASHARAGGSLGVESRPILPEESRVGSSQDRRDVMVHRLSLDGDYDASLVLLTGLVLHLCTDPESPLGHLGGPEDEGLRPPFPRHPPDRGCPRGPRGGGALCRSPNYSRRRRIRRIAPRLSLRPFGRAGNAGAGGPPVEIPDIHPPASINPFGAIKVSGIRLYSLKPETESGLVATPPRTGLYLVLLGGSRSIEGMTLKKEPVSM